jgi:DNA-binding transcriptional LysR family regulator
MHLPADNPCIEWMSVVNLKALQLFVATADLGGIGRASARMHLSQPAASRQLQTLESEFGIRLFERVGRRLRLTAEGEDLLRHARRALLEIELIADRARAIKGGSTGTLRIGATPQVIGGVLPAFLRDYCARYPSVEVELMEGGAASQPARLDGGEVDLAIMPVGEDRFEGRLLYPVHAVAVMPQAHRLARRAVLDVSDLSGEPLLVLRREYGSRTWFQAASEVAHFRPHIRLESGAPETLIELAAVGYGIAIIPSTVAMRRKGVRIAPLVQRGASLGRWSMIGWNPQRHLPPYAKQFIDELCAHVRGAHPGRDFLRRAPPLARPKRPSQ